MLVARKRSTSPKPGPAGRPLDMGADELLTAVAVLILNRLRPGLVRACWRAAQVRA